MASFRADWGFSADIVGTKPSVHWILEPNAKGGLTKVVAKNRIANGEIMGENPSGLPKRHKFHKGLATGGAVDEDWYMRFNDRTATACNAPHRYCPDNPFLHKGFQYNAMPKHHSRRVFKKMARQGHSFSEGNILALKEHPDLRKEMRQRYNGMMSKIGAAAAANRHPQPEPPPPAKDVPAPPPLGGAEPGSRCGSVSAASLPSLRGSAKLLEEIDVAGSAVAPRSQLGVGKDGSAEDHPASKPASRLSACWPAAAGSSLSAQQAAQASGSMVSASRPSELPVVGSSLSAMPPVASEVAASNVSMREGSGMRASRLSRPSGMSGSLSASALREPMEGASTVSDFFSWRPKLIR